MKKRHLEILILLISLFLISVTINAQNIDDFKTRIYKSYVKGEMSDWKRVLGEMEEEYDKSGSNQLLHELVVAHYGYIGFCLKEEKKKEASYHLEEARARLSKLREIYPSNAEYLALEGAFYGYEMGIHKLKAMIIGPRAKEKIDEAVIKAPREIRTMLEKANQLNFSPAIVGGDKEKAVEYYLKVIDKIESDPDLLSNNWIYVNTIIVLAQLYEKIGNNTYACSLYEKIMDYDPDIKWVRDDLYIGCTDL